MRKEHSAIGFAILAAALYALNAPLSKMLLGHVPPAMMASLLYLGQERACCLCAGQRIFRRGKLR